MNNIKLGKVTEEKDVGITVSNSLKPGKHCKESVRRANAVLTQISKAFHYRDRFVFRKLYITYVRPHLEYAAPVWNPWLSCDIDLLEKVQQRAVNMISGLQADTYEGKLAELGLDTLKTRRTKLDLIQTFKILKNIDNVSHSVWFKKCSDNFNRVTRISSYPDNLCRMKISKTDIRQNFFSQRVINSWNALPDDIKDLRTVKTFKEAINNHFNVQHDGGVTGRVPR